MAEFLAEGQLSRPLMNECLHAYWQHFNSQMPILHTPTFDANSCPALLLVALVMLGASHLETNLKFGRAHFLGWHLRREIFSHPDFERPVKLWALQTMVLLEWFETMCSTRRLHNRAALHHNTTVSPILTSFWNSGYSLDMTTMDDINTDNPLWRQWIWPEAIRRTASLALALDAIQSIMFGYRQGINLREINLTLPCNEALWNATSADELETIMKDPQTDTTAITLKQGLCELYNEGQTKSSPLGLTVLMAGLTSMVCNFNRVEQPLSQMGRQQNMGDQLKAVLHHLEISKQDGTINWPKENLRYVTSMAAYVDFNNCQVLAYEHKDYGPIHVSMKTWARSVDAQWAVFYAFRFLYQALPNVPELDGVAYPTHCLVSGSWVLYIAALIVWSYCYSYHGGTASFQMTLEDLQVVLQQMRSIEYQYPVKLVERVDCNVCLGLLIAVKNIIQQGTWELLGEASKVLGRCIMSIQPKAELSARNGGYQEGQRILNFGYSC